MSVPVSLLDHDRWDRALGWIADTTLKSVDQTTRAFVVRARKFVAVDDRAAFRGAVDALVDRLFDYGEGQLAIAWMAMTADPRRPDSFVRFMPALARLVEANGDDEQKSRLEFWWRGAAGEFADEDVSISIFTITEFASADISKKDDTMQPLSAHEPKGFGLLRRGPVPANHVVVMPRGPADERLSSLWKNMIGEAVPLVVAHDVAGVRQRLHAEFPHATHVVDTLLRDVRERKPIRLTPTILLGPPGGGKSRLARRVAQELGCYIQRHDAAGSHDSMFSGSPKAWAGSQVSVPARAIMSAQKANPIVLIDELEKAGSGTYNGRLWDSLVPLVERETSKNHPETGLDCLLDLSWCSYLCTANSVDGLPGPLLDRFRIVRVPAPTLAHLPALAASIMRDLSRQDDRMHDEPLADDELAVIGRAWKRERFSLRKLQRLVATTLEVRDQCARRH